jgi:hypothetical protein
LPRERKGFTKLRGENNADALGAVFGSGDMCPFTGARRKLSRHLRLRFQMRPLRQFTGILHSALSLSAGFPLRVAARQAAGGLSRMDGISCWLKPDFLAGFARQKTLS